MRKAPVSIPRERTLRLLVRQLDDAMQEYIHTGARLGAVLVQCGRSLLATVNGAVRLRMLAAIGSGTAPAEIAALIC
jgi:hypothetical protein